MAMRAPISTPNYVRHIQSANPLRKKALQAMHAHLPNPPQEISELPTCEMAAIARPKTTRPMLKTDREGRPYFKLTDPTADTLLLVQRAVSEFYAFEERYPDEIVLSPLHYFTYGMKWRVFYVPNTQYQIPYTYEGVVAYHVMARGVSIYAQR